MAQGNLAGPDFLEYLKDADYNLWVTFLRDPDIVHLLKRIDEQMFSILQHLNNSGELTAKDSFYYQTTFWIIANRQLRNSFEAALRRKTYDAMLLARPALESTVFAFRIFKEPDLLKVWAKKRESEKRFREAFRRAKYPADMPYAKQFKENIDHLNEFSSHPNLNYFSQSLEFEPGVIHVNYFDPKDDTWFYISILTIVSYGMRILEVMRATLASRFKIYVTSTEGEWNVLQHDCKKLVDRYSKGYKFSEKTRKGL